MSVHNAVRQKYEESIKSELACLVPNPSFIFFSISIYCGKVKFPIFFFFSIHTSLTFHTIFLNFSLSIILHPQCDLGFCVFVLWFDSISLFEGCRKRKWKRWFLNPFWRSRKGTKNGHWWRSRNRNQLRRKGLKQGNSFGVEPNNTPRNMMIRYC